MLIIPFKRLMKFYGVSYVLLLHLFVNQGWTDWLGASGKYLPGPLLLCPSNVIHSSFFSVILVENSLRH